MRLSHCHQLQPAMLEKMTPISYAIDAAKRLLPACFALGAVVLSTHALANETSIGKEKAQACAMCHGANGIAQMPGAPNLAGQPAPYLAEQLKNYRSGKRQNEIMGVIAKPLSDQDISALASWYASIQIEAKAP